MSSNSFGKHTTSEPKPERKILWTEVQGPLAIVVNNHIHHLGKGDQLGWCEDNQLVIARAVPQVGV